MVFLWLREWKLKIKYTSKKLGYGRDCDPGRYSHVILLKMHEMLQGCWFPFMVCWFICSFRPIFSMGFVSSQRRFAWNSCVLETIRRKKDAVFSPSSGIVCSWANLPNASSKFCRAFVSEQKRPNIFLQTMVVTSGVQWQDKHSCVASSMCALTRKHSCVASSMRAMTKQNTVALASSMCAMTRQTQLRSIQPACVSSSKNVIIPTPPHPTRRNCSLAMGSLTRPWAKNYHRQKKGHV